MDALLLFQRIDVFRRKILVDEHAVFQELIARYGAQGEALRLIFEVQPCIQQVTVVAAFAVVGDCADIGFHLFALGGGVDAAGIIVRIAALVAVFVAHVQVCFPVLGRQVDAAEASAGRLALVCLLILQRCVAEEAAFVVIEAAGRESETLGHPVVMRQRSVVGIVRACADAQVRALIGERRFGVNLNQSAHRIASVQRSLRAAQYVDAFDVGVVEVESGLVDVGDIVHIQSHGRRVDARTDTADIDGGSKARTVVGDEHVGNESGQVLDGVHLCRLHVLLRKQGDGCGLFAQLAVFFGGCDDEDFFHVYYFQGVQICCRHITGSEERQNQGNNLILFHNWFCFACKVTRNLQPVQS